MDTKDDMLVFKEKRETVSVRYCDIVFFESSGHYINVHLKSNAVFTTRCTIATLVRLLDGKRFVRVRRGIVVNLKYVHTVQNTEVLLKSAWGSVPVSRSYKEGLKTALKALECSK